MGRMAAAERGLQNLQHAWSGWSRRSAACKTYSTALPGRMAAAERGLQNLQHGTPGRMAATERGLQNHSAARKTI
ncbi:MAG: hypothetical protein IJJ26_05165 [Victivallales bacterium]|nr:hypothetical protein [Victivallales bacterium]